MRLAPLGLPLPLPAGIRIILDVGDADDTCRHPVAVPPGGFTVPEWCANAVEAVTGRVTHDGRSACTGSGACWDGHALAPTPDVATIADTSPGACPPAGQTCTRSGAVTAVHGDGVSPVRGLHLQVDIPVAVATWREGPDTSIAHCPDPDGRPNPGDRDIDLATTTLHLTTGVAQAESAGPDATCPVTEDERARGAAPAIGCCEVGQRITFAAAGYNHFADGSLEAYALDIPAVITACDPPGTATICDVPDLECRPGA